ncbi:MAG: hypothetical protein LBJ41_06185 [Treponema sp.]|nr:hypothetical protein [Treponema sp.]
MLQKCTEAVSIIWQDQYTTSHPFVLPTGDETLLGVIPLEDMDVIVNPGECRLVGAHGSKWVHQVR